MKSPRRSPRRLASDKEAQRIIALAKAAGIIPTRIKFGADGSIELDSAPAKALGEGAENDNADEEIRRCREAYASKTSGR